MRLYKEIIWNTYQGGDDDDDDDDELLLWNVWAMKELNLTLVRTIIRFLRLQIEDMLV